ncbi:MAG: spore germination protein [Bacillota bacterium]|uniref:Spore germination protein n=1 Tax=Thermanaerosceptrum fracticalcis TaxID=1712410 RepID=A0A7G6E352_THEFR|nr:spore germination protein [Thermanaerosceptrum fracticalcis]QNB46506.1 spore germination protein [Thermanaerosceptrum fracticalcis]
MFRHIFKKLHFWQMFNANYHEQDGTSSKLSQANISRDLKQNLKVLRNILGTSSDVIIREFSFGYEEKINAALIFLDGMTDKAIINESIIKPLMYDSHLFSPQELSVTINIEIIRTTMLSVGEVKKVISLDEAVNDCLYGDTILLIDGFHEALVISTKGWESRSVEEPKTEAVVRGPREGFTETLRSNTTLLRRKIRNPNFIIETLQLGEKTKTNVCIAYLKGVVNPRLVEEVKGRLKRIKTDAILESGYIEQFIEDAPFSPFPTVANSEKPDVIAAKLLEGRVAILVDGTPMVLTVPMVFIESFQTAEDYYSRPYYASIVRMLRFLAFFITITAPAVYVALTTFHQELIPTPLLITMAAAREGTPFPAVAEALIMGTVFEILREAGVRLPRPVGSAISIVGALVIGEAAVSAGLIGAPMVIVIALTAIASFVVPSQSDVAALLRLIFTVLAGFLGAFGIMIGLMGVLIHLCALRSFGTPYFSPLAPLSLGDVKDVFFRVPMWAMLTRPRTIGWHDYQRQEWGLMPHPPKKDE